MARKTVLAMGLAAVALPAAAQVVPDDQAPPIAGLDLPANLQIFGKADPNVRKPTAIVNDFVITGTDVDQRAALIIGLNNLRLSPEEHNQLRLQILRQLIDETLQIQAAAADKIAVDRAELDQSFNRVARNFERTPDQMRAWLRQIGSSERSIRRQIEGEIAWSRVLRRRVDISVSDAEIEAMLKRMRDDRGKDEYHFFEIYMNATPDRANEVFAAQQRIIEQMKQGQPFAYLARVNSEASTKIKGGDLGWVRLTMLPAQLAEHAAQMAPGQVAGPIEVPGGFSILYLAEKRQVAVADPRDAKLSLKQLTITFAPGTTEAQATSRAAQFAEATQSMQGCGDAERVARLVGAEVVSNDTMQIKQLPPALQDIMLPLQIGQSTQPFGSIEQGVRVLVLCGRDDPREFAEPSVDEMRNQIEEERTNLRAARMLRDLRRDAIIEYR
ncbi:peptidylprolyl isomerase [Sphingomonas sp. AOB5]|uniref:peptidylprolyl isomerase n=1 Tax=Sphingomonas sp. AOB5 TaxID=3034017 RepID=UPI0023F6AFEC|nr:peptidylprolyl isomerase [Sphingomonas sp. AOB5]MDF7775966.1 peptidylprolyl isomerase [Sphingomonas sp. AOB5]